MQVTESANTKSSITLHPVKIEAYDTEMNDLLFTIDMQDAHCAKVDIKTFLNLGNVDEVFSAIKEGLAMMKLDGE